MYENILPPLMALPLCHDAAYWQFEPEDIFKAHAAAVWLVASASREGPKVDGAIIGKMLLRPKSYMQALGGDDDQTTSFSPACGAQHLPGPFQLQAPEGGPRIETLTQVGPFCTEMGKFWLNMSMR